MIYITNTGSNIKFTSFTCSVSVAYYIAPHDLSGSPVDDVPLDVSLQWHI